MKRTRSLEEALRRLHAVIFTLDEDLRAPNPLIPVAERIRRLTGEAGAEARAALRMVAHSVDEMERYAAEMRRRADWWRGRSTDAVDRDHHDLADQARQRTIEAEKELRLYEEEIEIARLFLQRCSDAQVDWTRQ